MKQGFRPHQRLHRPAEFAAVLAARRVLRGAVFDLNYLLRSGMPDGGAARLGLVVPKRLARRAVMRNAIKRQAREAFRMVAANLPPGDLVLRLARAPGEGEDAVRRGWREEILYLLKRLREARA